MRSLRSTTIGTAGTNKMARRLGARLTTRRRALPTFLIIGTKRGGSTSLYEYLADHPEVLPCAAKKGTHYFDVNFSRGWSWFRSFFPVAADGHITGEGSPYYLFHPLAAARIAAALPDVKLIAALRDPVDRAYSHYHYNLRRGFETLPLEAALDAEPGRLAGEADKIAADPNYQSVAHRHHSYLARGRYAEQLERLYTFIAPERVLLLQSEAMYADPNAAMADVYAFLGLAPHRLGAPQAFKSGSYSPIAFGARQRLEDYYAAPNAALAGVPGVRFRWPYGPPTPVPRPAPPEQEANVVH